MFLLACCLLCLANPLLAYPSRSYQEPSLQSASLSGQADYPDLTNGLTDAEVQASLQDLTLDDLKSLDNLLNYHINPKEDGGKVSLRTESRQTNAQSFRSMGSAFNEGCRGEENDEQASCKQPTVPTTRRCIKKTTTCKPKTTTCKTTCPPTDDVEVTTKPSAKCPKPKNKCKPKMDLECDSDDYICLARKQMDKERNMFQWQERAEPKASGRELGGAKRKEESIFSQNVKGDQLDFLKAPKPNPSLEQSEMHGNQASWERDPLAKLHQNHHARVQGEHQSHLEQTNIKQQHGENLRKEHQDIKLKPEPQVNLQPEKLANLHQDNWANVQQDVGWANVGKDHWDKVEQENWANAGHGHWPNVKKDHWTNAKQAYFDQRQYANFEPRIQPQFQPAQEQHAKFQQENPYNMEQDNQASLKRNHPIDGETFEQEYRAKSALLNQDQFEQNHQASHLPDYHPADLIWDQVQDQPNFNWDQVVQRMKMENPVNLKQENPAIMPQAQSNREQRSEVTYRQSNQQWRPQQPLTNTEEFKKMEHEPVAEKRAPLEPYERHQMSRIAHQKRNAEMEKPSAPIEENKQIVVKHAEPQPVNADPPKPETHLDGDSFIANSARDPPRYLIPMQNDFIQSQNEPVERRLNQDRSLSEGELKQKRNAEMEKPSAPIEENKQIVVKHAEPQPVNADPAKPETHLDGDSFIANSARDPPRYLIPMQNDFIQSQNEPVERRLNQDRSLSEGLDLDKLTAQKEASPADWEADNKRGKRENRGTDDAPENSKETYIKKLMDSFPRDQGGQINANVALRGWRFSHQRIKRSFV